MKTSSKKGGLLIYMLGVIAILSIVVTEFLIDTGDEVRYQAQVARTNDLGLIARSYMEVSLAVLQEFRIKEGGLYSPKQGWGDPIQHANLPPLEDYTVVIKITDETGKIPLLEFNEGLFNAFLQSIGLHFDEANNVSLGLKEFIDSPPNIAFPGSPSVRKRFLVSFKELHQVPAFEQFFLDEDKKPNELYPKFVKGFSLYHRQLININTAPESVYGVIIDASSMANREEFFKSKEAFELSGSGISKGYQYDVKCQVLNISIEVWRGPSRYLMNAIVDTASSGQIPFKILDLTEGFTIF